MPMLPLTQLVCLQRSSGVQVDALKRRKQGSNGTHPQPMAGCRAGPNASLG